MKPECKLTPKEHAQAGSALVQWFNSQEIGPHDARAILIKVLAKILSRGMHHEGDVKLILIEHDRDLVHALTDVLSDRRLRGGQG